LGEIETFFPELEFLIEQQVQICTQEKIFQDLYPVKRYLFKVGFSFCFDASAALCEADVFFFRIWIIPEMSLSL